MKPAYLRFFGPVFLLGAICFGCSKDDLDKLVTQVQDQTQAVTQEVAKAVSSGSISMTLNGEIKVPTCTASLLIIGDGRPNVLQIRSYASMERESFPSILFQGTTAANSYQELAGKTVQGEFFVALDDASNIWQSDATNGATVTISNIEDKELVGQLGTIKMISPEGRTTTSSGSFRSVME
jgi:hypothetical protein